RSSRVARSPARPRSATPAPTGRRTCGCCSCTCGSDGGSTSRTAGSRGATTAIPATWPSSGRERCCNGRGSERRRTRLERAGLADRRPDGGERRRVAGRRAHACKRGARDRRRYRSAGRLRRRPRAGPDLHGRARRRGVRPGADRGRGLAGRARVDRPSRGELHGRAVRRVGDPGGEVLRDGLGPAARSRTGREGAVPEARLPRARTPRRARARDQDAAHGGAARYTVTADDSELAELVPRIPASASKDYGTPFYDIFKRYDGDFYKIDPLLFSPAEVWLTSAGSGKTYHAGRANSDVLRASLVES